MSRGATIARFLWGTGKCTTVKTTLPPRVRSYKRLQELAIEGKGKAQGALALLYAMRPGSLSIGELAELMCPKK